MSGSILVLEDDEDLRELTMDILEFRGFEVEGAANAEEAIFKDRQRREKKLSGYWLIISDVRMAGSRDGVGALEVIKQERPELRCIIITGYADQSVPLRALRIKADDYLYKPFESNELVAAIKRVQDNHQSKSLFQKVKDLLSRPKTQTDKNFPIAQKFRESCLHYFWVAIRSKALYHETAISIWDQLEEIELRFMECLADPNEVTLEVWRRFTAEYAANQERINKLAREKAFISAQARNPKLVSKPSFRAFFDKIQAGQLVSQDLIQAAYARNLSLERIQQDPSSKNLYEQFWGALP